MFSFLGLFKHCEIRAPIQWIIPLGRKPEALPLCFLKLLKVLLPPVWEGSGKLRISISKFDLYLTKTMEKKHKHAGLRNAGVHSSPPPQLLINCAVSFDIFIASRGFRVEENPGVDREEIRKLFSRWYYIFSVLHSGKMCFRLFFL